MFLTAAGTDTPRKYLISPFHNDLNDNIADLIISKMLNLISEINGYPYVASVELTEYKMSFVLVIKPLVDNPDKEEEVLICLIFQLLCQWRWSQSSRCWTSILSLSSF